MEKGKFFVGLVFIIGVVILVKGFVKDVKENTPKPIQYIMYFDARINDAKTGMKVTNQNDFPWPDPVFFINRTYKLKYNGPIGPGQVVDLGFADFKNETGASFPGVQQFHDFDVETATMAYARRR